MGVRGKPSGESLGLWGRVPPLVSPAAQQGTRAQRGCTVNARPVQLVCGSCAGSVQGG